MTSIIHKCPFCNIDTSKVVNTIMDETKNFYIMPALGSLTEGYIMIITKKHINSMSELTKSEIKEYTAIIKKYREIFKKVYQKYPIVFEHGTPNLKDSNKASSILHAHTHVVNHNYKNENALIEKLNFKRIHKYENIDSNKNYILYVNPKNEIYITNKFEPISQLMRVEIARDLNLVDKYSWHTNEFNDNILLTINKLNNYLENKQDKGNN